MNGKDQIVIVGAGASGMMAAVAAAEKQGGSRVTLLEKNDRAGRKLLATGNGRCNFTNVGCSAADFPGSFPHRVLERIPPARIIEVFEELGVGAREEEEGRVYPYSGRGASVCEALLLRLSQLGVEVRCQSAVKKIDVPGAKGGFVLTLSDGVEISCSRLILAVGGKAGCQYGSEGDGYRLAAALGHSVAKPIPALVQMNSDDPCFQSLSGVRAKASVSLWLSGTKQYGDRGEVQFTESGLSGICIFNLSRYLRYTGNPMTAPERYSVRLDFMEGQTEAQVLERLRLRRENLEQRTNSAFLNGLLHEKLSAALMERAGLEPERKAGELTDDQLARLAGLMKALEVRITGTKSWKDAQVTAGGVCTEEVRGDTLESRLVPGLYFAGELLDVDGPCGGYNLQWAFASGIAAGTAAAGGTGGAWNG